MLTSGQGRVRKERGVTVADERRRFHRLVPALFVLSLIGISFVRFPSGAGRSESVTAPGARQGVAAGTDLSGTDLEGKRWSLRGQRGRVVLMNYWATWCPPCRKETPGLVTVAKRYADKGLSVVGVSLNTGRGAEGAVRDFARQFGVPYPLVLGESHPAMVTPSVAAVQALPTTLLIDRRGRVAKTIVGAVEESALDRDIQALLVEPAAGAEFPAAGAPGTRTAGGTESLVGKVP